MHHTETRIYRSSLALVRLSNEVLQQLPTGFGFLADQLRRAAGSVTLNFAEGCGKQTTRDRQRFFHIARGSAYEVAAVFDVARCFGVLPAEMHRDGHALCDDIAAMLTRYR